VNHSPLAGLCFQVALPAKLLLAVENRSVKMAAAKGRKAHPYLIAARFSLQAVEG